MSLPGKSHGQRSLAGYSPWGRKESDTTEQLTLWSDIYKHFYGIKHFYWLLSLGNRWYHRGDVFVMGNVEILGKKSDVLQHLLVRKKRETGKLEIHEVEGRKTKVGFHWKQELRVFFKTFKSGLCQVLLMEKEMATHSSVLAWTIPGTGEPGGLLSMGSHRAGHDWRDLAAAAAAASATEDFWRWKERMIKKSK